jgi:hypothetical protein
MPNKKTNFGDILGPYLVKKLANEANILFTPISISSFKSFCGYIHKIILRKVYFKDLINFFYSRIKKQKILLTAGSIIEWYSQTNICVWGSGLINHKGNINNAEFLAVRGKFTKERIHKLYGISNIEIGDPGLLLPIVYNPIIEKDYEVGIVPHYIHYDLVCERLKGYKIKIINLNDPIEVVVNEIKSCNVILSSSLHGLIESHAYGIPALWVSLKEGRTLAGDNIKFQDYFSSLDLYNMSPIDLEFFDFNSICSIKEHVESHCDINLISHKVKSIQRNLLNVAPFKLKQCYEKI